MKKFLYILLPFLAAVLIFSIIMFLLTGNKDKGGLQVTSKPESKVYLNGKLLGQAPLCKAPFCNPPGFIDAGAYTIKLIPIEGNFEPFEQKITVSSKVLTVVDRNFDETGLSSASIITLTSIENKKDAQISVISFPDSSEVFLDNNLQGQTPILLKNITQSDHELKLSKEGYKDKIVRIRAILGYKLEALVFLGINPEVASASAEMISSLSAALGSKVLILQTPTGFLRVREDASISSNEIGQVKPGEIYPLLDEKTGWFQIQLNDDTKGWISSDYAKKQN